MALPNYVREARRVIAIALACVEDCPEAFKVVAFGVILTDLVENSTAEEEEG